MKKYIFEMFWKALEVTYEDMQMKNRRFHLNI